MRHNLFDKEDLNKFFEDSKKKKCSLYVLCSREGCRAVSFSISGNFDILEPVISVHISLAIADCALHYSFKREIPSCTGFSLARTATSEFLLLLFGEVAGAPRSCTVLYSVLKNILGPTN